MVSVAESHKKENIMSIKEFMSFAIVAAGLGIATISVALLGAAMLTNDVKWAGFALGGCVTGMALTCLELRSKSA